jgi:hypothetical protein
MVDEINKIFYSQFKEAETYLKIVKALKGRLLTFKEIAEKTGKGSGGTLKKALELLINAEAGYLAEIMGFKDEILLASPYFRREEPGFQVDLVYKRADKVIVACEIKFSNERISTKIIPEMEKKCTALNIPRGYTLERALISLYGPDEALRDSCYFNHHVTGKEIIDDRWAR